MDTWAILIAVAVVGSRFLVPLLIPLYPLPAMIACLIIDAVDQTVFQALVPGSDLAWYQGYDKALDIYYLSIAYLSTLRNWTNIGAFRVSQFLYYYRLVGAFLFEASGVRAVLMVFPNTFEYFFDVIEAIRVRWDPRRISVHLAVGIAAFIWIVIKLPQEWWIHVAQLDTTDIVQERIFGVPAGTSWADTFAGQWWIVILFVAIVIALIVLAWWVITRKLPPADRPPTFRADAQQPPLDPAAVERARIEIAGRLLGRESLEKLALLILVTGIFGMGLDVPVAPLPLAIAIGLVVIASTAVSQWLTRRGSSWESAFRQFLLTLLIDGAIVAVLMVVSPLPGGTSATIQVLFFVVLLSVLITMYDRYRPRYVARSREA